MASSRPMKAARTCSSTSRAVERSGLTGLADNQKVNYDLEAGRDGRESAVNLQVQ
jgi:cold shock CspA family protein